MNIADRDSFIAKWKKYFHEAELPLAFYYTDAESDDDLVQPGSVHRCLIADLLRARKGQPMRFNGESIGCFGGKRYLGFATQIMPNFEYFLSCGIPGKLEGERCKKTPELVKEVMSHANPFNSPARYIVFKRWDLLEEADDPAAVIFFATPDVLAGLFTLAGFAEAEPNSVISPFGSGCSSIVYAPYQETLSAHPRPIIGMFDISARPYVDRHELSFAVPMKRFMSMVSDMDESFLITRSWSIVRKRIA